MNTHTLRVGIDVGSARHRVAVGLPDGTLIDDEFDVDHHTAGFSQFFRRIAALEACHQLPVTVAMEGYNGWARPLDGLIRQHGWALYNVNNLKLARYKEIFPAPARPVLSLSKGPMRLMCGVFWNCFSSQPISPSPATRCKKSQRARRSMTRSNA